SLLNFTSFLSEGTGIAIVGGLLSLQLINRKLVLEFINYSSGFNINILLAMAILIILFFFLTFILFKRFKNRFDNFNIFFFYSNILVVMAILIILCCLLTIIVFKRSEKQFE